MPCYDFYRARDMWSQSVQNILQGVPAAMAIKGTTRSALVRKARNSSYVRIQIGFFSHLYRPALSSSQCCTGSRKSLPRADAGHQIDLRTRFSGILEGAIWTSLFQSQQLPTGLLHNQVLSRFWCLLNIYSHQHPSTPLLIPPSRSALPPLEHVGSCSPTT